MASADGIVEAKIAAICLLALVSLVVGLLPLLIVRRLGLTKNKPMNHFTRSLLSGLLCFGGGVLMATAFLHLLPDVREGLQGLIECHVIETELPLAEIVICAGFFLVYLVEEIVHLLADRFARNKADKSLHRTLSVRRCSVSRAPPTAEDECTNESKHEVVISCSELNCAQPEPACSDYCHDRSYTLQTITGEPQKIPDTVCFGSEYSETKKVNGHAGEDHKCDGHDGHSHGGHSHCDSHSDHSHQPMSGGKHHHHGFHLHDDSSFGAAIRGLLVIVALSLHEVFEGLAIGLQTKSASDVWQLFAAVATHKYVIVLCVGLELATTRIRARMHVIYISILSVITSVGIGIGMGIASLEDPGMELIVLILQGLAAGTLLYVTFFEILERERSKDISGLLQLTLLMIGFCAMLALESISGHSHDHGESHCAHNESDHKVVLAQNLALNFTRV